MLFRSAEAVTTVDRRRLSFAGIVTVSLALTDKGQLAADPALDLIGIPERTADGQVMAEIAYNAVVATFDSLPKPRRRDPDAVAEAVRRGVRAAIAEHWRKKPMCRVQVLEV